MTKTVAPVDAPDYDRTVTLRDLFLFAARNRWIILASFLLFAAAALAAAKLLPPKYEASITLVPPANQGTRSSLGSLSSAVSQFSGLASIAGIHIGATSGSQTLALATLKSRLLLNKYIEQQNLMPVLFPSAWNAKSKKWRFSNVKRDPTLWDADQLFHKIRTIKASARTGVVRMTITWHNPVVAAQWANGLVVLTNRYLRHQTISRTRRELRYLRKEVSKTNVVGVRNAIYTLMETEIKTLMVANARKQFAFRVVDPAIPPSGKIFPRPLLWTIAGGFAGALLGAFFAILRETLRADKDLSTSSEPLDVHREFGHDARPSLSAPTELPP